jgi:nitroimidazol reductase NimA-like FMN-containing flavoprotein (pyridoxamine 5'-phosphate oxidase superfamily)
MLVEATPVPSLHAALGLERWLARQSGMPRLVLRGYLDGRALFAVDAADAVAVAVLDRAARAAGVEVRVIAQEAESSPGEPTPQPLDEAHAQVVREALAGEWFGVLVTLDGTRPHTSTVLFAESPDLTLLFTARRGSRKARLLRACPTAAFHVDTRGAVAKSPQAFVRIAFRGTAQVLPPGHPGTAMYRRLYTQKLPPGRVLLAEPDILLYVFQPATLRLAVGGAPARDFTLPRPAAHLL